MNLRIADNSDGETIKNLCLLNHFGIADILDWSDIYPYWLVCEREGLILGALQVCPGKPIGRAEWLAIDPALEPVLRARVFKQLTNAAMQTLKLQGGQVVIFMVPFEMRAYKRLMKKHGCVVVASGNALAKRLT